MPNYNQNCSSQYTCI